MLKVEDPLENAKMYEKENKSMSIALRQDLEELLRSATISNPEHKEALRKRLFGDGTELELDDLAMVAGGLNEPFISPEDWSDKDTSHE